MSGEILQSGDWRIITQGKVRDQHLNSWCERLAELCNCEWTWVLEDSHQNVLIRLQPSTPLDIPEASAATAYCNGLQDALNVHC